MIMFFILIYHKCLICILVFVSGCSSKNKLYSLEEAYENKLITKEDLWNIAYIYNDYNNASDFEYDTKENSVVIDKRLERKIKKAYLKEELSDIIFATIDGVNIKSVYGLYGDSYVLEMDNNYEVVDLYIHERYEIDGVVFLDYTSYYFKVYVK
jgi:hypothetical protein